VLHVLDSWSAERNKAAAQEQTDDSEAAAARPHQQPVARLDFSHHIVLAVRTTEVPRAKREKRTTRPYNLIIAYRCYYLVRRLLLLLLLFHDSIVWRWSVLDLLFPYAVEVLRGGDYRVRELLCTSRHIEDHVSEILHLRRGDSRG
jgi:hypothetical protein